MTYETHLEPVASMSHVISVVTAAYQPAPEYLTAAYESLRSQHLPEGWQWQWVVQEDGQTGDVARSASRGTIGLVLVADAVQAKRQHRTMCLSRATGDLIKVLDSDDQLMPGTLAARSMCSPGIQTLDGQQHVSSTYSQTALRLGSISDPPEGKIELGQVLNHWRVTTTGQSTQ